MKRIFCPYPWQSGSLCCRVEIYFYQFSAVFFFVIMSNLSCSIIILTTNMFLSIILLKVLPRRVWNKKNFTAKFVDMGCARRR